MAESGQVHHLLGLSGVAATRDDPARMLEESLPVLLELGGADAALVVQQTGEGLTLTHATGMSLGAATVESDDLARGALLPVRVPAAWQEQGITAVSAQPLPGHLGVLALAWSGEPGEGTALDVAASVLETGLARVDAASDLSDLVARVDNAQHLAHMGDYDWHIPSDTNQWSDELFRIYGHEPQSFNATYERFLSLIHPDDRERITAVHQRAYATGEPYQMMERIVRPDGEVRYLASNGQVVMDEQGVPVRMRGTCIDVTDRILAERESEHLDARYAALVAAAPFAILVLDGTGHIIDANPQARALLEGDPTRRWAGDLGYLEGEGLGVELTTLAGSRVLVDVTRAAMSPGEPGEPGVGLVAVFLRDATDRLAGEELAAHRSQAQLRRRQALEINDNVVQGLVAAAYALDAEQYPVVGSYVDRTLSAARSMMDDLLEPLDGHDLAPGDLVRASPATIGRPGDAPISLVAASAPTSGHRVLVVDDSDDLRSVLCRRLDRTQGYSVVGEAADGHTAVDLARELRPDLVLLDLAMPHTDGLQALPQIREALPDARIIVFSGFNQKALTKQALATGADRYVVKGGSMRELMAVLDAALQPS